MSNLMTFQFNSTEVRTVTINGDVWFVAQDISETLGYRDARDMVRVVDEDEADTHTMRIRSRDGAEQNREVLIINESGLYHALFKSRKPDAAVFRKWVTSEVLPSIRKTGSYTVQQPQAFDLEASAINICLQIVKKHPELAAPLWAITAKYSEAAITPPVDLNPVFKAHKKAKKREKALAYRLDRQFLHDFLSTILVKHNIAVFNHLKSSDLLALHIGHVADALSTLGEPRVDEGRLRMQLQNLNLWGFKCVSADRSVRSGLRNKVIRCMVIQMPEWAIDKPQAAKFFADLKLNNYYE